MASRVKRPKKVTWTVKSLLKATLALFEKRPELWGHGSLGGMPSQLVCDKAPDNCFCIVTGLHHVYHGGKGVPLTKYDQPVNPEPANVAAAAVVHFGQANKIGRPHHRTIEVTQWNDAPGRTVKEIHDAFRKAIRAPINIEGF